jgi:hypothetical protein
MTTLIITFKCPNDDTEIEVRLPVVGKQMSLDKLDAIPFSVYCPQCKWQGQVQGSHRSKVQWAD